MFTRARLQRMRIASWLALISNEKKRTVSGFLSPLGIAADSAKFKAAEVFPHEGLAARIIISCFWNPHSNLSRSMNPDETPVSAPRRSDICLINFIASSAGPFTCFAASLTRSCVTANSLASTSSTNVPISPVKERQLSDAESHARISFRKSDISRTFSMKWEDV